MSKPKYEIVIPPDSADYLERKRIRYDAAPLVLDDGTELDLNAPSPFDPPGTISERPAVRDSTELLEALWLQEAAVFESELHPRWPKGAGEHAGQFMRVGQHFKSAGIEWQIAHIVKGRIYAHRADAHYKGTETRAFEVGHGPDGAHVPGIERVAPEHVPVGGKGSPKSTVTIVDPYVDHASHDPAIPIPPDSPITPEEWLRFGKLDQEHYTELQERFGKHKAGAAKSIVDKSYSKFSGAAQQAVKQAYSAQYGSSTGFTLSLASPQNFKDTPQQAKLREECLALQAEHMAAVQWDLYNRTHSPDMLTVHKDSDHNASWWESEFIEGEKPVMSGLSQSHSYRRNFFGSVGMATPLAIRHVLLSSASAQPIPNSTHFPSELEVSVPYQMRVDKRSIAFTSGGGPKQLQAGQISWLEGMTQQPVGATALEKFKDALANGTYLPPPPKPANISMDGANGKTWVDPPDEAAKPEFAATGAPTSFDKEIPPAELPKDWPWSHTDSAGLPEQRDGKTAGAEAGQFFMGLKGTLYWLGPDPGVTGGYPFRAHKIVDGTFNGENFAYNPDLPGYYLDAKFDISKFLEKQNELPDFHPEQWAKSTDTKFLEQFEAGEKFKIDGTAYEVTGKATSGQMNIKDLESGLTGKINGDYKSTYLVPYGSEGSIAEPGLGPHTYAEGEWVKSPFGKAQVTAVEDHELPGGGKAQLVTVQHLAGGKPAEFGSLELSPWGTQAKPEIGATFEYEGKKAVVTKILKSGLIQSNVKPGKLMLTPKQWQEEHAHHAVPAGMTIDAAKTKLGKMQVGDLFQGGAGNQTVRPYQVVHSDEASKSVHVMNLDTGVVSEMSKNTGYRRLFEPSPNEEVPAADEPKGAPVSVTGGGTAFVGLPWDPSKFEEGPALSVANMRVGTYFKGKTAGSIFQKIADDGNESLIKDTETGTELPLEHELSLGPSGAVLTTMVPKGVVDLPAWDAAAWGLTGGPTVPAGELPDGQFYSWNAVVWQKLGNDGGHVHGIVVDAGAAGNPGKYAVGEESHELLGDTHVTPWVPKQAVPPVVHSGSFNEKDYTPGPELAAHDMPVGTYYKTAEGNVILKSAEDKLTMVKGGTKGTKAGESWGLVSDGAKTFQTLVPKAETEPPKPAPWPGGNLEDHPHAFGEKRPLAEIRTGTFLAGSNTGDGYSVWQKIGETPDGESKLQLVHAPGGGVGTNVGYTTDVPSDIPWAPITLLPEADNSQLTGVQPGTFDPSSYIVGEKVKLGELEGGDIFKTTTKSGAEKFYQLSADKQTSTNLVTGKTFPAKQHYKVTLLTPEGLPPEPASTAEPEPNTTFYDIPVGGLYRAHGATWEKQGGNSAQIVDKGTNVAPNGHVETEIAYTKPVHAGASLPQPGAQQYPVGTIVKTEVGTLGKVTHHDEPGFVQLASLGGPAGSGAPPKGDPLTVDAGSIVSADHEPIAAPDISATFSEGDVTPLTDKPTHVTPYEQLAQGDTTKLKALREGDQFTAEGGTLFKVTELSYPGSYDPVIVQEVFSDGLGPNQGMGPDWPVTFQAKAGEVVPPPPVEPVEAAELPHAEDAGGLVSFKVAQAGKFSFPQIGSMAPDTVFEDESGHVWMVKQAGAEPIISDGEQNYRADPAARGWDYAQQVKPPVFVDKAPPVGGASPSAKLQAAQAELVNNGATIGEGTTVGGLNMDKPGEFLMLANGEVYETTGVQYVATSGVGAGSHDVMHVETGKHSYMGKDVLPVKVSPGLLVAPPEPVPEVAPSEAPSPTLFTHAVKFSQIKDIPDAHYTFSPGSAADYAVGDAGEKPADYQTVYVQPVTARAVAPGGGEPLPFDTHAKYGDLPIGTHFKVASAISPSVWVKRADGDSKLGQSYTVPGEPPSSKVYIQAPTPGPTAVPEGAPFTYGVSYDIVPSGAQFTMVAGEGHVYTKSPDGKPNFKAGTVVFIKPPEPVAEKPPVDPATAPPVHSVADMAPPEPPPVVHANPGSDILEPYKARQGPGGIYTHPRLHETQVGQLFTDQSGHDYKVVLHEGGKTVYEDMATGTQHTTPSTHRVKLTALPPNPGPKLAPVVHDLTAKYGSLTNIPKMTLESAPTQATGTGKKATNPRLGHLKYGQVAYDDAGHKVVFLASWLGNALVLNASTNEPRLADAATRVTLVP